MLHHVARAALVMFCLAFIHISRNSSGNMTPFEVFSFWKFPWKYDLLWRQKLQETGISSRFPAVSTVSDALHPTSRAEKYPRPLIFSFHASFPVGKSLNTKIASTECFLGRVRANFALAHQHVHVHVGEGKREFPVEMCISHGNSSGKSRVP